jgi:hypothetical protein
MDSTRRIVKQYIERYQFRITTFWDTINYLFVIYTVPWGVENSWAEFTTPFL